MRRLYKTACCLFAGLALGSCAGIGIGGDHIRWTEEVKLSDGRVIEIQRHGELTTARQLSIEKRGSDKYHEICYPPMGIHWKSRAGYLPDIFDIVEGKAYMHVPISDCFSCERYGYPKTNAVYFAWEQGGWKRISHDEFPTRSEWNLLRQVSSGSSATDPKGLVTLADKARLDRDLRFEQTDRGWKRISESNSRKNRCVRCRGVKNDVIGQSLEDFTEILTSREKPNCSE